MSRMKLDRIDRKILHDLQKNGRTTNVDLARHAGISAPPCLRRLRALEENGIIKGYHARLDEATLGYGITGFVLVKLVSQADADLKKFNARLAEWPEVREAYLIAGDMDYMLKIAAKDWEQYQTFLTTHLNSAENVTSIKSSMVVKEAKYEAGVPIAVE